MDTVREIIELLLVPVLIPLALWLRKQWQLRDLAIAQRAEEKVRAETFKLEADATIAELSDEIADVEAENENYQQTIAAQDGIIDSLTKSVEKLSDAYKELSRGKKAVSQ